MRRILFAVFILLVFFSAQASSQAWVSAYYPAWAWDNGYTDKEVPWDAITHLIYFSSNPSQSAPYFDSTDAEHSWVPTLVAAANAHGVKPLLCVGGVWGDGQVNMEYLADDVTRLNTFVQRACSYAKRKGYAGIDVDWEPPATDPVIADRLLKAFYDELGKWSPRGILSIAATQTMYPGEGYTPTALNTYVDQINQMTYDYGQGQTAGHNTGLHFPTQWPGYSSWTIDDHGPMDLVSKGVKKEKLALGLAFYGRGDFDVTTPGQAKTSYYSPFYNYQDVLENLTASTYHWDNQALVPWLSKSGGLWSGGVSFLSYDDSMSIDKKVQWVKANGIGGLMIFELRAGWDPSKGNVVARNPLAYSVKKAMGGTVTPPVNYPSGTFTASASSVPAGGGSVTLTWTSSNATSASIDNGIGSLALNGSTVVSVTAAKIYNLTLTNNAGTQSYSISVSVDAPIPVAGAVPGQIEGESYKNQSGSNIQTSVDPTGGNQIAGLGAVSNGAAWAEYSVNVSTAGKYRVDYRYAAAAASSLTLTSGGTLVKATALATTSGWNTFVTKSDTVTLFGGTQTLRVAVTKPVDFNWMRFVSVTVVTPPPPPVYIPPDSTSITGKTFAIPKATADSSLWFDARTWKTPATPAATYDTLRFSIPDVLIRRGAADSTYRIQVKFHKAAGK